MLVPDNQRFMEETYEERKKQNLERKIYPLQNKKNGYVSYQGKDFVNFSSNDYLGLAWNKKLHEGGLVFQGKYGNGATASRMVTGGFEGMLEVETKLASLKEKQRALLLASGYQANVSLLAALSSRKSLFLVDRLAHHSLLQGILAGGSKFLRFRHNDILHLKQLLQDNAKNYERLFIVTESVFSMDGDKAPLDDIIALKEQYNALLYLDEAHATGILGENGMGLSVGKNVDFVMGTCGKALGSFGAYIACSEIAYRYFLHTCSGLIYSTALPPYVVGSINAALDLVPVMIEERKYLLTIAKKTVLSLRELGFTIRSQDSQIIPLWIGDAKKACDFSDWLKEEGFWVTAIRYPTVPRNTARLRIALSCVHTEQQIDRFISFCKIAKQKTKI